ncbi:MAG: hypothetical protein IKM01_04010 [Clostridia bacterium]|nr:hypothetical protein [Clostridia bacterium]
MKKIIKKDELYKRFENALCDAKSIPEGAISLIGSDIESVISAYFIVNKGCLNIDIGVNSRGEYEGKIEFTADRFLGAKTL